MPAPRFRPAVCRPSFEPQRVSTRCDDGHLVRVATAQFAGRVARVGVVGPNRANRLSAVPESVFHCVTGEPSTNCSRFSIRLIGGSLPRQSATLGLEAIYYSQARRGPHREAPPRAIDGAVADGRSSDLRAGVRGRAGLGSVPRAIDPGRFWFRPARPASPARPGDARPLLLRIGRDCISVSGPLLGLRANGGRLRGGPLAAQKAPGSDPSASPRWPSFAPSSPPSHSSPGRHASRSCGL